MVVPFGLPVDLGGGDVVEAQDHLGVLFERLAAVGLVVLRGDGQHDPAPRQRLGVLLEGAIGLAVGALAQGDAQRAGLADDAAPEGVVQVEHQDLLGPGGQGAHAGEEVLGQPDGAAFAEGLLGPVIAAGVVERLAAHHAGDHLEVEEVGAGGSVVPQGGAGGAGEVNRPARLAGEAEALGPGGHPVVSELEDPRAHPRGGLPGVPPEGQLVLDADLGAPRAAREPLRPGDQRDDVGPRPLRGHALEVLQHGVIAALGDRARLAVPPGDGRQRGDQPARGALAQQVDAEGAPGLGGVAARLDDEAAGAIDLLGAEAAAAEGLAEDLEGSIDLAPLAQCGDLLEELGGLAHGVILRCARDRSGRPGRRGRARVG